MTKLYELLAIESELKAKAISSLNNLKETFQEKRQVFEGQQRNYTPLHEDGQELPSENLRVQSDVRDLIGKMNSDFFDWVNVAIQKEETNIGTTATIESLGVSLSSPALMNLQNRLLELRSVLRLIPVNDQKIKWASDDQLGYYKSDMFESVRLAKMVEKRVLFEPTEHQPGQGEFIGLDQPVGKWETTRYSSMLQPKEKQEILDRIDLLIIETKEALKRANDVEVTAREVSSKVLDFIFQ